MRRNKENLNICGTCRHHRKEKDGSWVCANPESDYYADWTEYGDNCDEHEERPVKQRW